MREAASFIANQSRPFGALSALVHDISGVYRSWRNRRELASLADVDDHLLADMGLSRSDVKWALSLPFAYDPGFELQRIALRRRRQGWRA
jgi:uncharacterized protein YjiS (DUF1127 family)